MMTWLFLCLLVAAAVAAGLWGYRAYVTGDASIGLNLGTWFAPRPEPRLAVSEQATLDSRRLSVGRARLPAEARRPRGPAAAAAADLASRARTVMFVAELAPTPTGGGRLLGLLGLADTPRQEARSAIAAMRRLGTEIVMLTGDAPETAEAIGREVAPNGEISRVRAGVLPGHKADEVKALQAQGRAVAMVGDGINDAPQSRPPTSL